MKENDLINKYIDAVKSVSKANGTDSGVSMDIIKHEYWASKGMNGRQHRYQGVPANFDFDAFGKDLEG